MGIPNVGIPKAWLWPANEEALLAQPANRGFPNLPRDQPGSRRGGALSDIKRREQSNRGSSQNGFSEQELISTVFP